MIELKKDFEVKKYRMRHHQLYKDAELVIYEVTQPFIEGKGHSKWHEVFRYRVMPPDMYHQDEFEKYPNDEAFGVWAWSCSNDKVVNKVLKREFPNHPMAKDGFKCHICYTASPN